MTGAPRLVFPVATRPDTALGPLGAWLDAPTNSAVQLTQPTTIRTRKPPSTPRTTLVDVAIPRRPADGYGWLGYCGGYGCVTTMRRPPPLGTQPATSHAG